jgi:hypothetical protein
MDKIKPYNVYNLWVGHAGDCRAFRELLDKGIRAIVQLAIEEPPVEPPRELIYYRFPLLDGDGNDAAVAALIRRGIPTLVCCGAGMSRSPAIAAAALSVIEQIEPDECLRRVAEYLRADVSPGLWAQVRGTVASLKEPRLSEE